MRRPRSGTAATGAHVDMLVGYMAGVSCVAWALESDTLATGSDDKAIRLWLCVTGLPELTSRNLPPGGGDGVGGGPAADNNGGAAADARSASIAPLRSHHNYVNGLAFSAKGNMLTSGSYDEAIFLRDVRAGWLIKKLPAHSDPVSGIDFSPDGTLVASCSTDGLM